MRRALAEAIAALPPEKRVRVVYHHVRKGDTLGGIADKYGVSVAALKTANKIRGTLIRPGQDLLITAAPTRHGALQATRERRRRSKRVRRATRPTSTSCVAATRCGASRASHGVTMESSSSSNGLRRDEHARGRPGAVDSRHGDAGFDGCRRGRHALDDLRRARGRHAVAHREQVPRPLVRPARLERPQLAQRDQARPAPGHVRCRSPRGNLKRTARLLGYTHALRVSTSGACPWDFWPANVP